MDDCVFCKIINKEIPANIINENDDVIVFMSLENHPLIVTKKHIKDIYELDEKSGIEIMKESIKISKATKTALKCDGIYVTQANEPAGGQDVFHYHMHIYPRWDDNRQWEVDAENRKTTAEKIIAEL
jgi:histidine triad (HIT) family protein